MLILECESIPTVVIGILSQLYRTIIVLIPLGMVIFGSIDFIKAIAAKDENAIATSSKTFISRLIAGALTFFVLTIVSWLFTTIIGNVNGANEALNCALDIISGKGGSNYSNSNNFDWVKDTMDTVTSRANCLNDCNTYCGQKTNSSYIAACQSYCGPDGQKKFSINDAPCN